MRNEVVYMADVNILRHFYLEHIDDNQMKFVHK